jgi:uncharacterized protein YacL
MEALTRSASGRTDRESSDARDWGTSLLAAAVVFLLAYLGFVVVPNALATSHYLSTHLIAKAHDAAVVMWVAAFFVFQSWFFLRVQRWLERRQGALRS